MTKGNMAKGITVVISLDNKVLSILTIRMFLFKSFASPCGGEQTRKR